MNARVDWRAAPVRRPLRGTLTTPGDKSISHRAIMLAALADGTSHITGFLEGEDTRATARIFGQMGVRIDAPAPTEWVVHGVGLHGLRAPDAPLDCGNSGTAMRLLAGLLAGQAFDSTLVGDSSLSRRPMQRVAEPLLRMGAHVDTAACGVPPLQIHGGQTLRGIEFASPVASAQVKSAVLLAGLYAAGTTTVTEPRPTRDYTERMLAARGWPVAFGPGNASLTGRHTLRAVDTEVPADFSSAAFFIVAATLVPGSELRLCNVGVNPRRTGLLRVLRAMGADIDEVNPRESGGEPVADLVVRYVPLHGIEVPTDAVADMIDEFPALFVAVAAAAGTTAIHGAAELRVKESDRIAVMAAGLRALGVSVDETSDGARIEGGMLRGGAVDSGGDHRCAMAFAVAGAIAAAPVWISDCANVATSFPGFIDLARECGLDMRVA